jgi:sugar (pentulose or hexulose) kinase
LAEAHQSKPVFLPAKSTIRLKGISFSGYGASFVHVDKEGKPVANLYNT